MGNRGWKIDEACPDLKERYDECHNRWYKERFMKGDTRPGCGVEFAEYQECVMVGEMTSVLSRHRPVYRRTTFVRNAGNMNRERTARNPGRMPHNRPWIVHFAGHRFFILSTQSTTLVRSLVVTVELLEVLQDLRDSDCAMDFVVSGANIDCSIALFLCSNHEDEIVLEHHVSMQFAVCSACRVQVILAILRRSYLSQLGLSDLLLELTVAGVHIDMPPGREHLISHLSEQGAYF